MDLVIHILAINIVGWLHSSFIADAKDPQTSGSITFYGWSVGQHFISTFEPGSLNEHCDKYGKFAIVTHGYLQNCTTPFIVELMDKLGSARGGCILCMDYSQYSQSIRYSKLVDHFDEITNVLVKKLRQFESEEFKPINGYMFGFSFGAQLVINGAFNAFGTNRFGLIDGEQTKKLFSNIVDSKNNRFEVCDPAGPMFDRQNRGLKDAHQAAINVQCIHTSRNFGTELRMCDQNWLMGYCGKFQSATVSTMTVSHTMCPIFYNLAFDYEYPAVKKSWLCKKTAKDVKYWPAGYRMGYDESRLHQDTQSFGILYANTYAKYPYNQC